MLRRSRSIFGFSASMEAQGSIETRRVTGRMIRPQIFDRSLTPAFHCGSDRDHAAGSQEILRCRSGWL